MRLLAVLLSAALGGQPCAAALGRAVGLRLPATGAPGAGLAGAAAGLFAAPRGPANLVAPSVNPSDRSLSVQVIAKVMAEVPAAGAGLRASLEAAPFRPALGALADPDAWLAERLGEAFVPYFETYAREVGHPDAEAGLRYLLSDAPAAVETRRGLGRLLQSGSARSESWTYIYRDAKLWQKHLEDYLDGRVAAKRADGSRELHLQSVGAAYGAEPYTLAMLTEDALLRAGENPAAWRVRVDAADLSLMSLISAREGFYRDPEGGGYFIPKTAGEALRRESAAGRLLPAGTPGLYRLREDLRDWVRPLYLDLNDLRQQRAVTEAEPDVVFANYVLTHLRPGPAARLAEHWMSGSWSDHGFLGMAQTLVAEVARAGGLAAKGSLGRDGSFLRRAGLTVGAIGAAYAGESNEPWQRFRDWLFTNRGGTPRRARQATARYREAIRRDPFHAEDLDPKALLVLEQLAARLGVRTELTTDDSLAVGATRDGAVAVGVGLLMPGGGESAARIAFLERLVPVYAARAAVAARAPPAGFSDPRFGAGELAAVGTAVEGARLKAVRFGPAAKLLWLVPGRLAPISDHYVDEKPPAPPRPAGPSNGGITVRF